MKLGVGGGAFGVRGGISTRGIGVGVGPFSAGTSWRGRRSQGGGAGGGGGNAAWLIVVVVVFLAVAWPYFLGTFIAVQCGAWNPSTERLVVGWCFEVVYIAGLVACFLTVKAKRAQRAAAEAQRMAELTRSDAVYEAKRGSSVVYRHGTCTVNHKSQESAASCPKSSPSLADSMQDEARQSAGPLPRSRAFRSAVAWPAAILIVGFAVGAGLLAANPIHTPAGDAAMGLCPNQTSVDGSPADITMPDIIGQNAGNVEDQLRGMGITGVSLSSANPDYKEIWKASNWTVVSTDPKPGCVINGNYPTVVYVTK
jgi:hypothetical protein